MTTQFINDDRCTEILMQLVKEGANELKTFIVCTSLFHLQNWHLFKVGHATLKLTVQEGDIVDGKIVIGGETFSVEAIDSGLSGTCVALIIKKGELCMKLYLNVPLKAGANPALSALCEVRQSNILENVATWIKNL